MMQTGMMKEARNNYRNAQNPLIVNEAGDKERKQKEPYVSFRAWVRQQGLDPKACCLKLQQILGYEDPKVTEERKKRREAREREQAARKAHRRSSAAARGAGKSKKKKDGDKPDDKKGKR
jgi:hypothetical protein